VIFEGALGPESVAGKAGQGREFICVWDLKELRISFDPNKQRKCLHERRLDFNDASKVFSGTTLNDLDDRFDYGEDRWVTIGMLYDTVVVVVWTETRHGRHIISMRKAGDYEQGEYYEQLDRPG
jgi:uncharacterized DUF497 family protein